MNSLSGVAAQVRHKLEMPAWLQKRKAAFVNSPLAPYYLLIVAATLLSLLGLVMVLSSTTVRSITAGMSPYAQFFQQGRYALIGIAFLLLGIFVPIKWVRRAAWPIFIVA
ncbi:MAG: FtsW/RodA/SpoVE family cell cycle protein, partial [Promicromonosporaceae bacterium]|nr:FtsW/RodA/SpoVE family cell cycle protein [Promicromonosporaceae bacterium]